MKIKINGSPEDLIQKLNKCKYCIFEDILTDEQRKIKVLDSKIPKNHPHRKTIEDICGKDYDEVCPMKYAAMRCSYDDFMASQFGAIKDLIWDLGKKNSRKFNYEEAIREWAKTQYLGNKKESYAERFRKIWDLGLRENKQILNSLQIYEMVISDPKTYKQGINFLKNLQKGHLERAKGKKILVKK